VADKQATTLRVFFALWPDSALQTALHNLGNALNPDCGGRAVRPETIHLTLAFIAALPADRIEALYAAAARVDTPAFDWQVDQLGYWRRNQATLGGRKPAARGAYHPGRPPACRTQRRWPGF